MRWGEGAPCPCPPARTAPRRAAPCTRSASAARARTTSRASTSTSGRASSCGITGVSGAGKSSLALDTLYSEGQRRFVESFSPYARQFLERLERPPIDALDPVAAGVAVDRHAPVKSSRSTVATMADVEPYFCALFAREAAPICPEHGVPAVRTDPLVAARARGRGARGRHRDRHLPRPGAGPRGVPRRCASRCSPAGYRRLLVRGEARDLDEIKPSEAVSSGAADGVDVVVDRVKVQKRDQTPARRGHRGGVAARRRRGARSTSPTARAQTRMSVAQGLSCPVCARAFDAPRVGLFSYQSPTGACPECRGFGRTIGIDWSKVVPDESRTHQGRRGAPVVGRLDQVGAEHAAQVLRRAEDPRRQALARSHGGAAGGRPRRRGHLERRQVPGRARLVQVAGDAHLQDARARAPGALPRLRPLPGLRRQAPRARRRCSTTSAGSTSPPGTGSSSRRARPPRRRSRPPPGRGRSPAGSSRSASPTWRRSASATSRSTARRARSPAARRSACSLTSALGTSLTGALFVLDEPTVGLHPSDVPPLVSAMRELAAAGNAVLVIEHEPHRARRLRSRGRAGAGRGAGGRAASSTTGRRARAGAAHGARRPRRRRAEVARGEAAARITIDGARANNLRDVSVDIPLGVVVAITGPSGSGKSTLVEEVLFRGAGAGAGLPRRRGAGRRTARSAGATRHLRAGARRPGAARAHLAGQPGDVHGRVGSRARALRQAARRRWRAGSGPGTSRSTSRSAGARRARARAPRPSRCSSSPTSRSPARRAAGGASRTRCSRSSVDGRSVADVLALSVDEALAFFAREAAIVRALGPLSKLGLGYLALGQPLSTLSGGEAQRIKLAQALGEPSKQGQLVILDEPSAGLHPTEVARLNAALADLARAGASVVVVDHDLDVIARRRLGDRSRARAPAPTAGGWSREGTPAAVAKTETRTGTGARTLVLAGERGRAARRRPRPRRRRAAEAPAAIEVVHAREHNLREVSASIPHGKIVVVTGPSGSGKSTLAFDVVFAEGQRRFLETLTPYARQFLPTLPRPDVDRVTGVPPSIALEQRTTRSGSSSTVATVTEIAHYLRLLYAKVGDAHCPVCDTRHRGALAGRGVPRTSRGCSGSGALLAPAVVARKGTYLDVFTSAARAGVAAGLRRRRGGAHRQAAAAQEERRAHHRSRSIYEGKLAALDRPSFDRALSFGKGAVKVRTAGRRRRAPLDEPHLPAVRHRRARARSALVLVQHQAGPLRELRGRRRRGRARPRSSRRSARDPAAPAGGRASRRCRARCGSRASATTRSPAARSRTPRAVGEEAALRRRPEAHRRGAARASSLAGSTSCSRWGSATSASTGARPRSPAARCSGSASRRSSAAGSPARSTCSTSPPSACTRATPARLLGNLRKLADMGSTVLMVEHDADTIRAADYLIDLGPSGGRGGGRVVAAGPPAAGARRSRVAHRARARRRARHRLGARLPRRRRRCHRAHRRPRQQPPRATRCASPSGRMTVVAGVSGSGKSTLVRQVLYPAVRRALGLVGPGARRARQAAAPEGLTRASSRSISRRSGARRDRCRRPSSASGTRCASSSPPRPTRRCAATGRRASRSTARRRAGAARRATATASSPTRCRSSPT